MFTIIITTYKRLRKLDKLIAMIISQIDKDNNIELIIVDNDKNKSTQELVSNYIKRYKDKNIRFICESRRGPSFARNTGARSAVNKYLVFLDDDILIDKKFSLSIIEAIRKYRKAAVITGKIIPYRLQNNAFTRFILRFIPWIIVSLNLGNKPRRMNHDCLFYSACLIINKRKFTGNIFNERFGRFYHGLYLGGEDNELFYQLIARGEEIIYDPHVICFHQHEETRLTARYVLRKHFESGFVDYFMRKQLTRNLIRKKQHTIKEIIIQACYAATAGNFFVLFVCSWCAQHMGRIVLGTIPFYAPFREMLNNFSHDDSRA